MKRVLTFIPALLLLLAARSQNIIVQSGAYVKASSAGSLVLNNMGLQSAGTLDLAKATLYLTGNNNAGLTNSAVVSLKKLVVDKAGGAALLNAPLQISEAVVMQTGLLDLNGNNITLQPTALLLGESESSHVIGPKGGFIGITTVIQTAADYNPGNLGLHFWNTANLDTVTVKRSHYAQSGNGISSSILRTYDVYTKHNLPTNIRFDYLDAELNGLPDGVFNPYQSTDGGQNWTVQYAQSKNRTLNWQERYGILPVGRLTLALPKKGNPAQTITDTKEGNRSLQLQVYPNPAIETFSVLVQMPAKEAASDQLYIMDAAGHMVQQQKITYNTPVKIEGLMPGVYLLKLASHTDVYQKVVVQ